MDEHPTIWCMNDSGRPGFESDTEAFVVVFLSFTLSCKSLKLSTALPGSI